MTDCHRATIKSLVQRANRQISRKRTEPGNRMRELLEFMILKRSGSQNIPPIVEVSDDQTGKMRGLSEQLVR